LSRVKYRVVEVPPKFLNFEVNFIKNNENGDEVIFKLLRVYNYKLCASIPTRADAMCAEISQE